MALRVKPNWLPALRMMIASNAMQGQAEQAKQALRAYLRINPEVTIAKLCEYYPFRREADRQRLIAAMRKAGRTRMMMRKMIFAKFHWAGIRRAPSHDIMRACAYRFFVLFGLRCFRSASRRNRLTACRIAVEFSRSSGHR
jgi:hypothetical protein